MGCLVKVCDVKPRKKESNFSENDKIIKLLKWLRETCKIF